MTEVGSAPRPTLSGEERAALADDIRILIRLHDKEPDVALIESLRNTDPSEWFSLSVDGEAFTEGARLFKESLAELETPPSERDLDLLAAEFAGIYLNYDYQAAPTESVWRDEENLERQAAMFMARDWYARYGLQVPNWRIRSDDHLVNELHFVSVLLDLENKPDSLSDAATFLRDHLLVWIPEFAKRVTLRCEMAFYAASVLVTYAYLQKVGALLGEATGVDMTLPDLVLRPVGSNPPDMPDCGSPRGDKSEQRPRRPGHVLFESNPDGRQSRV